jgi:outer membrane protein OmpA-like peptidoglycan-associated protein
MAVAQVPNPTQTNLPETSRDGIPIFRTTVVSRSIKSINYHHRQGSTVVGLEGSAVMPKAVGEAKVESKTGATKVQVDVDKMPAAQTLGEDLLTYVVWAITPEGRAENLGELMLDGDHARLQSATELQSFGLIVTAEPYYAVSQPSDMVVMENVLKPGTTGTISVIDAKYELLAKGSFVNRLPAADRAKLRENRNVPLDLLEARHAVAIARSVGAAQYAADTLKKADIDLYNAEAFLRSKGDKKKVQTLARNVTQLAEDARIITVKKLEEESLQAERTLAADRVASAQTTAEQETRKRELAEADRKLALESERNAQFAAEQDRRERRRVELQNNDLEEARRAAQAALKDSEAGRLQAEEMARKADLAQKTAMAEQERLKAETEAARLLAAQEQARLKAETLSAQAAADQAKKQADEIRLKAEAELAASRQQQQALASKVAEAEAAAVAARAELLRQLNVVLQTRESARGLIVNMSDVLFDTGQWALRPGAREKLSRISGIVMAHPGLKLEVEGHTDSVGDDNSNQVLSERRAESVRKFLVQNGVPGETITSKGFGESTPVADNNTAAGRMANRRVELVVSGSPIQVTTTTSSTTIR